MMLRFMRVNYFRSRNVFFSLLAKPRKIKVLEQVLYSSTFYNRESRNEKSIVQQAVCISVIKSTHSTVSSMYAKGK